MNETWVRNLIKIFCFFVFIGLVFWGPNKRAWAQNLKNLPKGCTFEESKSAVQDFCDPRTKVCEDWIPSGAVEVLDCIGVDLRGETLAAIPLRYGAFTRADLSWVRLRRRNLKGVFGDWARWDDISAARADFSHGFLVGASFQRARLYGAVFVSAFLLEADFQNAGLEEADFYAANLRRANFSFARLKNTDFREAHLKEAQFRGADLSGADFTGADVSRADFSEALDLEKALGLPREILEK